MYIRFISLIVTLCCCVGLCAQVPYTVIANPGENASEEVSINFHTDPEAGAGYLRYAPVMEDWGKAIQVKARQEICTAYDSMYSKRSDGENFYETVRPMRNVVNLSGLKPDTKYRYLIEGDTVVRYFRTAPAEARFTAAIISDFHCYPPLPGRQRAAMAMLDTLRSIHGEDFDLIIHLGDVCAWGGSYSFWRQLYEEPYFKNYTWAGLNGNHDNMDRTNKKNSGKFFKNVNAVPLNGYEGQEGVCYYFKYGDVLFVALNSEAMRTDDGLAQSQVWVDEVIKKEKAEYVVVMEHYQWFFGENGMTSQYARWCDFFDSHEVSLALGANNHRYVSTPPLRGGNVVEPGEGTVYIQTPSSDNERGESIDELEYNADIIKTRWAEGSHTVGAMLMDVTPEHLTLSLYDRYGNLIDRNIVSPSNSR